MEQENIGPYEFKMLSDTDQQAYLWTNAIYIGNRVIGEYKVNLYTVSDFFVEVYYDGANNVISHLKTFKNRDLLIPYIMLSSFNWN